MERCWIGQIAAGTAAKPPNGRCVQHLGGKDTSLQIRYLTLLEVSFCPLRYRSRCESQDSVQGGGFYGCFSD